MVVCDWISPIYFLQGNGFPMKSHKNRYVIWHPDNRLGDFEFFTSTQENYCTSLTKAKAELTNKDFDWEDSDGNYGYDRHPKEFHIYEIKLTRKQ